MKDSLLRYKNSDISYTCFGDGPGILLCFHGYGEKASAFNFLEKYIGSQYTAYSVDLPFHGKTDWKEGYDFTPDDLLQIARRIIIGNSQKQPVDKEFSLIGYSLGGRMALCLYQTIPERVEKLILLAPDGLKVNFWYWLSTQTLIGNKFFAFTMKHPGWFFGFLKLLNKLGLVNASIFKFVNYYIENEEVRKQLYARWTALRKIKPSIEKIKEIVVKQNTPVKLIYGKHDRIILSSVGDKFRKGIEKQCTLSVIPSGHQVLHEKHAEDIVRSLSG